MGVTPANAISIVRAVSPDAALVGIAAGGTCHATGQCSYSTINQRVHFPHSNLWNFFNSLLVGDQT